MLHGSLQLSNRHKILPPHMGNVDKMEFFHFAELPELCHIIHSLMPDRILLFQSKFTNASKNRNVPSASTCAVYSGISKETLT